MKNEKLVEGDSLPEFELKNQEGELVKIKDYIGRPMVIYFYPKDDTPGCTKEACSFRDSYEAFTDAGCEVFGISGDSVAKHKKFKEKHRLPFQLLADEGNKIRKQFGVPTNLLGLLPGRVTYIINKEGKVAKIFNSQMQAEKHVSEALEGIRDA
ncbi:MAG: peroxiredoxin [Crocinitomicaceae bacterium]